MKDIKNERRESLLVAIRNGISIADCMVPDYLWFNIASFPHVATKYR